MKLPVVDRDECTGCGACEEVAPGTFELDDEDIAIVIQDLSASYRMVSEDIYTNKNFKPPIYKQALPINAFDLIKRTPGETPFEQPDFRAN